MTERIQKGAIHVLHSLEEEHIQLIVIWLEEAVSLCRGPWEEKRYIMLVLLGSACFSHLERLVILIGLLGSKDTQHVAEAQSGVQTYFLLIKTARHKHM